MTVPCSGRCRLRALQHTGLVRCQIRGGHLECTAFDCLKQFSSLEMALLGACNPLLDIVADVPQTLLDEYDLPHGGAVLANEKQMTLLHRLPKIYSCKYLAGGCGQNTIRVYQALSRKAR